MLTVVVVNAVLVFCAVSSWNGIATSRAFERGIAYNRLLAAAAAEEALGWQADISYRDGSLIVALREADGGPIDGAAVVAEAQRPLERQTFMSAALDGAGEGRYVATLGEMRRGQWEIRLSVVRNGAAAHVTRRLVVQ
jgi:nitrogen fixation protein FixH